MTSPPHHVWGGGGGTGVPVKQVLVQVCSSCFHAFCLDDCVTLPVCVMGWLWLCV